MSTLWRPFMWSSFALAGVALYFVFASPGKAAGPVEVVILSTTSSDGEHSPCG